MLYIRRKHIYPVFCAAAENLCMGIIKTNTEILKNGKRFIDGWVKTDKFRWSWVAGYVEGNISYETKIVNYITNQYKFIETI